MSVEYKILLGNSKEKLKEIPDNSIDCCITSPPYYGLRDYGNDEQIGLEETPEEYIDNLLEVFREVKRVLKPDGTFWLNIGDSYNGSGRGRNADSFSEKSQKQATNVGSTLGNVTKKVINSCKPKDMIGIPWLLAFALRNDGWYLRQDIIWHKTQPMPEPVKDRCVKAHEYIFLLSKSPRYFFDYEAIQEEAICKDDRRCGMGHIEYEGKRHGHTDKKIQRSFMSITERRNKRDVWSVHTDHFEGAHFATFPVDLVKPMVLAGSRGGVQFLTHLQEAGQQELWHWNTGVTSLVANLTRSITRLRKNGYTRRGRQARRCLINGEA